jgi:hypothetical protein
LNAVTTYWTVLFADTALIAIVAAMTLFRYNKHARLIKLLGLLHLAGLLANVSSYVAWKLKFASLINVPGSLYDFILVLILSVLYYLETGKRYQAFFFTVFGTFAVLGVLNLLFVQQSSISSYNKLMSSMVVLGYAVLYFYRLMKDLPTTHVHRLPMFWFNSALLIYHAGSLFLFAFTSYLIYVLKDNLTSMY